MTRSKGGVALGGEGGTKLLGSRGSKRIAALVTALWLACLAPATPALAGGAKAEGAATLNEPSLKLLKTKIGHGYKLSGLGYKTTGRSVLFIQFRNDRQFHGADFYGPESAQKISDSLRKITIDLPFDGGFGKAELSSKVPASAVHSKKIAGCSGKKYSVTHELSGVLKFRTGSDRFGTIRLRRVMARVTAYTKNFQCQPVETECPERLRMIGGSTSESSFYARRSNGKGRIGVSTYEPVTSNTAIYHGVEVKVPGSAIQLADDLSSGTADASSAGPDMGGMISFSGTGATTDTPGDCGVVYHDRDGTVSGVGFHAEFDWGGSLYPLVGGPVVGYARYVESP